MCILVRSLFSYRFQLGVQYVGEVSFDFVWFRWFVRKSEIIWFDTRVLCFCILGCEKTRGDGKCVLSFLREATEQLLRD